MYQSVRLAIALFSLTLLLSCQREMATTSDKLLEWTFPIHRPHAGILLGNGNQGLMVWGTDSSLNITIAQSGFWDRRNGKMFDSTITYSKIKNTLQRGDFEGLQSLFGTKKDNPSFQLGGGRFIFNLPPNFKISKGTLNLSKGEISIAVVNNSDTSYIQITQSIESEIAFVQLPKKLQQIKTQLIPAYDFCKPQLVSRGISSPEMFESNSIRGFYQSMPSDPGLCVAYKQEKQLITLATALGYDATDVVKKNLNAVDFHNESKISKKWWVDYWKKVPTLMLPDRDLQEITDYGLYKLACSTPPHSIPCSLQGPFMEEYQLPAWSNDYHFNINTQMIYWPVLPSNCSSHMTPLWNMMKTWQPRMQANGKYFFNNDKAWLLPHAVNDSGMIPKVFWTGMIDHASTAWMAQMAWRNYRFTLDTAFLREWAYPFMKGAFEGYFSMLEKEKTDTGGYIYSLPISVSPEFKGARLDAWGKNASFQLAALHFLTQNLPKAATILHDTIDARWLDIETHTPQYTTILGSRSLEYPEYKQYRIALWEGMDLIESHRHHSHLASIYPFETIDPLSEEHKTISTQSLYHLALMGMGNWTGWCVPWASIIQARCNNPESAVAWLHLWKDVFTNEGRGTLHNAAFSGFSTSRQPVWNRLPDSLNKEIMQLDAGFGALQAVYEILVQNHQDTIVVLPVIPRSWNIFSFQDIATEGAFKVSAFVEKNKVQRVDVLCQKNGMLFIKPGFNGAYIVNNSTECNSSLFFKNTKEGEKVVFVRK